MYRLKIKTSALRDLMKLPHRVRCQIDERLKKLAEDPERRDLDTKKLKGHDLCRLRSGDYRVIYQVCGGEMVVLVVSVGHRREVYR